MLHVVVDGANVVGSRPDGWWRDRAGAAARLAGSLDAVLCADPGGLAAAVGGARVGEGDIADGDAVSRAGGGRIILADPVVVDGVTDEAEAGAPSAEVAGPVSVTLVLEGAARSAVTNPASAALEIVRADRDGDSAIAARTLALAGAGEDVVVVTADRELCARVRAAGGRTTGPSALRRVLDHPDR